MTEGSSVQGSKHKKGMYAYSGVYPFWTVQEFPLDEYLGEKIMIRIGLISGSTKYFDGWLIKKAVVRLYEDILSADETAQESGNEILIYPNPVEAGKSISIGPLIFKASNIGDYHVNLYDLLGSKILSEKDIKIVDEENYITLPLDGLLPGYYFLELFSGNNLYFEKIIITP